ncbi:hypothetical protein HDZ31DRAFT_76965 [Schizophyllum fasciatum]
MTAYNAAQHERTPKHTRAVERYVSQMRRINVDAARSEPIASVYEPYDEYNDDPYLAPILASLATGRASNPSEPRHEGSRDPAPPSLSPELPHLEMDVDAVDVDHHKTQPNPRDQDPLRAAVEHAIHLHTTHQISDESDSLSDASDGLGDRESTAIAQDEEHSPPPISYLNIGSQQAARRREVVRDGPWYPWPNGLTCTLDIASNLRRTAYSDSDMELMLWLLQMNGVADVPSVHQMKADQQFMDTVCGIETKSFTGSFGHTYYMIPPREHIKLDFADPKIRDVLQIYPEDAGCKLHECCQADRWLKEMDPHLLTPMVRRPGKKDFYIFEPAVLSDDTLCIPTRWFRKSDGRVWGRAFTMTLWQNDGWVVEEWNEREISEDELMVCGEDVAQGIGPYGLPKGTRIYAWAHPSINPRRTQAKGHRCVAYPAWAYCDDTSGNRSKKWNEHNSYLMVAAGLPREFAHKEENVHFLCTSNAAPPLEMLEGVVQEFEDDQRDGIWAYDCKYGELVLVIPSVLALLGDNPMQSEFACHAGLRAKFFCRICDAKGKDVGDDDGDGRQEAGSARRESANVMVERVKRFMTVGKPRTPQETRSTLRSTLKNVLTMEPQKANNDLRTRTGIKDNFLHFFLTKALKRSQSLAPSAAAAVTEEVFKKAPSEPFSPVWRLQDIDPHAHTPVEILHVVLLGFLKYFWRDAISRLSDEQKEVVKHRLSTMNVRGLDPGITALRGHTLVQYCGSLVGRDFRIVNQTAIFSLYDMLPRVILDAWAALSSLVPLLWQPGTDNKDVYLERVEEAIARFIRLTMKWSPRWANKPKFHLLLHIPEHIRRFGPPIVFATEVFESYNAIIRAWSVNSNGLAPSRDIARAAASARRVAHIVRGGFFQLDLKDRGRQWMTAGKAVEQLASISSVVTRRMGLVCAAPPLIGSCRFDPESSIEAWRDTMAATKSLVPADVLPHRVRACRDVVIANWDTAVCGDFAVLDIASSLGARHRPYLVKVLEIIAQESAGTGVVPGRRVQASHILVQLCITGGEVLPYGMPRIIIQDHCALVAPSALACLVNAQHNCAGNHCDLGNTRPVYLERERTTITLPAWRHFNEADLVLNTAKMRDALFIQPFASTHRHVSMDEVDEMLRTAVAEHLEAEKA